MIKHFCDVCGTEIHGDHSQTEGETTLRSKDTGRPYKLAVSITVAGATGETHPELCGACVFSAIRTLDPTPREATP